MRSHTGLSRPSLGRPVEVDPKLSPYENSFPHTLIAIGTLMLAQLGHAAEFWSDQTPIASIYPHGTGMTSSFSTRTP